MIDLVKCHPFEQFCIAANNKKSFGSSLVSLIENLIQTSHLRLLDITHQNIGDIGMFSILKGSYSLEELWFDGFQPSSLETFLDICQKVLDHPNLKFSSFPITDAKMILSNTPNEQKANINKKINTLKTAFEKKFGSPKITEDGQKPNIDTKVHSKEKIKQDFFFHSVHQEKSSDILEMEKDFELYDQETLNLLKECSNIIGKTPILKQIEDNDHKTCLTNLILQLKKKFN